MPIYFFAKRNHQTKRFAGYSPYDQALDHVPDLVNLWSHPADQICDYSEAHAIDLIVIGSHGRSGIKEALLGGVSHSVANRAACAVTIVR